MSGPYFDVYVLCSERTEALAERFLAEWAPNRTPTAVEYEIPQYSDTYTHLFEDAGDLIRFLESNAAETQAVYWESGRDDEIERVMVFFTSDGGMVAGLSISDWDRPREEIARIFFALAGSVGARFGYVTAEEAPVYETQKAFRAECERREIALIDGARIEPAWRHGWRKR